MKKTLIVFIILFFNQAALADVRLIFTGDIMMHVQQLEAAESGSGNYDFAPMFENICGLLRGDLVIGNLETTFAGEKRGYSGYPAFSTPDELADQLRVIGFNVLLLANNHIYDKGVSGLTRTIEELDSRGFFHTGAWSITDGSENISPLLIEIKGVKVGIFNYSYGSNVPINKKMQASSHLNIIDESSIRDDIKYLRDNGADFIIAAFHWGNEYQPQPSKRQRELAKMCFEEGVDIIIGTHPHVLQPIDIFELNGKVRMAAYSLGNFVSYQRTRPRERSVILAVNISSADSGVTISDISVAPIYVQVIGRGKSRVVQVVPASGETEESILEFLNVPAQEDSNGFYFLYDFKAFYHKE